MSKYDWIKEWERINKEDYKPSPEVKAIGEYLSQGLKIMCSLPKIDFKFWERK